MKPPSRQRTLPSRFLDSKKTEETRKYQFGLSQQEQRDLRKGLITQRNSKSELDLLKLRKSVPKRTLLEVQNLIKILKTRVVKRVNILVKKQKKRPKVPIEIWAELAQKMTGVHEETISSAFSQMLVIAATEPCSRLHSDLHRPHNHPDVDNLRTTPLRPKRVLHARSGRHSRSSPGLAGESLKTPLQSPGISGPLSKTVIQSSLSQSSTSIRKDSNGSVSQTTAKPSIPTMSKSAPFQLTGSQSVSEPKPSGPTSIAAPLSLSSNSNQKEKLHNLGQFKQDNLPKSEVKRSVDFCKIYQFMNHINTANDTLPLTAMESAVLLDLLMSLPEELPLLDCKELQHHLLQVYTRLTTETTASSTSQRLTAPKPVTLSITTRADQHAESRDTSLQVQSEQTTVGKVVQNAGDLGVESEKRKVTELTSCDTTSKASTVNPQNNRGNWATTGLCPLNPFMVPVALLKRK